MIKIRDKDVLYLTINFVFFLCGLSFMFLDTLFVTLFQIAVADPDYTELTSVVYIMHELGKTIFITAGVIVVIADVFWIFRVAKQGYREYRRDNL